MFKCEQCGCCCRNINRNDIYKPLDRGDGVCKYLKGNLCSIYKDRPLLCRIDDSYDSFFKNIISKEEFYKLNKKACKELQDLEEC